MAVPDPQAEQVHLSKVQISARKSSQLAGAYLAFMKAAADFKSFHNANQGGEYGSHGSIFDPNGNADREATLANILDDAEHFIKETGVTRGDHAAMVALAFDAVTFNTEFREFLAQRVANV